MPKKKDDKKTQEEPEVEVEEEVSELEMKLRFEEAIQAIKNGVEAAQKHLAQFPLKFMIVSVLPNGEILLTTSQGLTKYEVVGLAEVVKSESK